MTQNNPQVNESKKPVEKTQQGQQALNWTQIETVFDQLDDMRKRVTFLRDLISQANICSDTECEIYPALHNFKSHTKNLREFEFYCISDSQNIKNELQRKSFIELMRDLEKESESVFSKIFALFSVKKTKEKALEEWHKRQIEIMKIQNESRLPISQEFVDSSQRYIDGVQKNIQDLEIFQEAKKKLNSQKDADKVEKKT